MSSGTSGRICAKKYMVTKYFHGEPKESDFIIVEEELPELKDGEILVQAEYLSVDPYMRAHMHRHKIPTVMIGRQVAKVIESRNDKYPVGTYVVDSYGWRTHTVCNPDTRQAISSPFFCVPEVSPHSVSIGIGFLDVTGNTAYFGMKEICKPKAGETVVITGAAGAVGSHAGQIAKILGCRAIGFAGSDEKCDYLVKELGFDHAFNYKTTDITEALKKAAPNGVDCYFDNVGGEISNKIMKQMNKFGRVALCGCISSYNDTEVAKVSLIQPTIIFQELKMEGFIVNRWADRWSEGANTNLKWLNEGKLKYKEHMYYGFENMVKALNSILRGENIGKGIVKAN